MTPESQPGSENAKHDATSGEYEKYFQIKPGHLVLDLGAHVGYFSEHACNKGARVIAFEPHPENFKALSKRIYGLGNPPQTVFAVNVAASNEVKSGYLHQCDTNSGAHSLFKHGQCSDVKYEVPIVDIGEVLSANGFKPDFIKVDTEGSELNILESLFRHGIKTHMAIETHDSNLYDDCRKLAEANGMEWMPKTNHVGVCHCWPCQTPAKCYNSPMPDEQPSTSE